MFTYFDSIRSNIYEHIKHSFQRTFEHKQKTFSALKTKGLKADIQKWTFVVRFNVTEPFKLPQG